MMSYTHHYHDHHSYYITNVMMMRPIGVLKMFVLTIIWMAMTFILTCNANLNLFLKHNEVLRLLGLKSELYYVREGKVNDYALQFVVPVQADISELHFTWETGVPIPMPYSIALSVSDLEALHTPSINITRKGNIPMKQQVFRITLPCTGRISAEIEVQIFINITMSASSNITSLNIKRKKICLKTGMIVNENAVTEKDFTERKELTEEEMSMLRPTVLPDTAPMLRSASPLYVLVGCASGMILIFSILALMCYVRSQKRQQTGSVNNYGGSSTHLSFTKPGQAQAFLRVDTPSNNVTISKTGSQYSSFRRLMTATPSSLYRTVSVPIHIAINDNRVCHSLLNEQITELALERRKIMMRETDKLLSGTFGQIYRGVYMMGDSDEEHEQYHEHTYEYIKNDMKDNANIMKDVMVKTISDQASHSQINLFMTEGMMMRGLKHPNVLSVLATCIDDPRRPLIVYPLLNQGNLKLFLQKCRSKGQVQSLLTRDLVQLAIQIGQGVVYLHKKKIIHGDLSTRNCVVNICDDNSFLVKITDKALSRDIFPNDYHCLGDNENRPIKWLAIESLIRNEFTQASDVWSFGVTIWELMTFAQQPYLEIDPFEMEAYLCDGYRLFQPMGCPDKLYEIMIWCWNELPDSRPTFPHLVASLQDFYTALGKYI